MSKPVLLIADDGRGSREAMATALRRRYAQDYLIVSEDSSAAAFLRLQELRAAEQPVAVVMAGAAMTEASAAEFLAGARTIHPSAKRVGPGRHASAFLGPAE